VRESSAAEWPAEREMIVKRGRVLLADSHEHMLFGVKELLDGIFEVVLMVADEKSLVEAANKIRPELVVVDLSMPVSGEVNVARTLRRLDPELKFIILSVHDERMVADECLAAGASGYVLKRTASEDLMPAVEKVLSGGIYVSPTVES